VARHAGDVIRCSSPSVPGNEDVYHFAISVKEWHEVIGGGPEGYVQDQQAVGPCKEDEPSCCILGKTTRPSAEDGGLNPIMGQGPNEKEEHKEANVARKVSMNIPKT
jgi:hypothetical protein